MRPQQRWRRSGFAGLFLGVEGADTALQILSVRGFTLQMRAKKRPWRPADLLTLDEIRKIHQMIEDTSAPLGNRVYCGHLLHLLYSRSSWSDLQSVQGLFVDEDERCIEVTTKSHKGARSAETKPRLLPIVAPCQGVTNTNWVTTCLKVRKLADLENPLTKAGPMLQVALTDDAQSWSEWALSSAEGSEHSLSAPKTDCRRISTHSLKSTLMSWAAYQNLPELSWRVTCHQSQAPLQYIPEICFRLS